MESKKRVIFIHGWGGYPNEGWRPWLQEELEMKGYKVLNPFMPNTDNPEVNKWISTLSEVVDRPDENTILVGHSLGAITILRYLESLKDSEKIGGAVFIAGFANDLTFNGYKGELTQFVKNPLDWEKIRKHCKFFSVIQSKDDQWVSVDQFENLKLHLKGKFILTDGMKHFSGDDGITKAPLILQEILSIQ